MVTLVVRVIMTLDYHLLPGFMQSELMEAEAWWHTTASVNWVIIGSGNGLLPYRHQAITWTNTDLLSIWHLGTNFSEILIKTQWFSFKQMHLKMSSAVRQPFCSSLNVLTASMTCFLHCQGYKYPCISYEAINGNRICGETWILLNHDAKFSWLC